MCPGAKSMRIAHAQVPRVMTADRPGRSLGHMAFWVGRDTVFSSALPWLLGCMGLLLLVQVASRGSGATPPSAEVAVGLALYWGLPLLSCVTCSGGRGYDLSTQWVRFLFSAAISPTTYYAIRAVVSWLVVLSCTALICVLLSALYPGSGISAQIFLVATVQFWLIAGSVAVVSSLSRYDWVFVFLLFVMQERIAQSPIALPRVLMSVHAVLPPFHAVQALDTPYDKLLEVNVIVWILLLLAIAAVLIRQQAMAHPCLK